MTETLTTAERLIDIHGRDAVGEAFFLALDARASGDTAMETLWIDIAVEIMHTQRVRSEVDTSSVRKHPPAFWGDGVSYAPEEGNPSATNDHTRA
jgi:hypothetical protein